MRRGFVAVWIGALIGLSLVGVGAGVGQAAAPAGAAVMKLPVYEVVSIKLNKGDSGNMMWSSTSNGVRMENVTMMMLVQSADYALRHAAEGRITGLPGWAAKEHFDVEAKVSEDDAPAFKKLTEEQRCVMFRSLLEDRFKFKAHAETREMPIYTLVVGKSGLKMKPTTPENLKLENYGNWGMNWSGGRMVADVKAGDMDVLTDILTRNVHRTVVDKTGLTGKYDFKLQWIPEDDAEGTGSTLPGIFTAIQEQLGLRLDSRKGPVEQLVVDHVEEPSAN